MAHKHGREDNTHGLDRSGNEVQNRKAARPGEPSKPDARVRNEQLVKHNPAQGSPSIRRNLEAGKPKEQRTNRGAKLGPNDES